MASSFSSQECPLWQLFQDDLITTFTAPSLSPVQQTLVLSVGTIILTFVVSTVTRNYSQVDKLWSILPCIYAWQVVCDQRTLLMAVVSSIWGIRLTFNFHRRGGYQWPPWAGEPDYRWVYVMEGHLLPQLKDSLLFQTLFNLLFISFFQIVLLWLTAAPSVVAHLVSQRCGSSASRLTVYDGVAAIWMVLFVILEGIADNQQYAFQTEKYRRKDEAAANNKRYEGSEFNQSGVYAVVRKANYAAEQAIWLSNYLFTIGATQGMQWVNWSLCGSIILCLLFQGTSEFTERLTLSKYPQYADYMKSTPLFLPNPFNMKTSTQRKPKHT